MEFSWPVFTKQRLAGSPRTWTATFESYDQHLDLIYYQVVILDGDQPVFEFTAKVSVPVVPNDDWRRPEFTTELHGLIADVAASGQSNSTYEGLRVTNAPAPIPARPVTPQVALKLVPLTEEASTPPPTAAPANAASPEEPIVSAEATALRGESTPVAPTPVAAPPVATQPPAPTEPADPDRNRPVFEILADARRIEIAERMTAAERLAVEHPLPATPNAPADLECQHVGWRRRAWVWRAYLGCFVAFNVLFGGLILVVAFGAPIPHYWGGIVVAVTGGTWLVVMFVDSFFPKRRAPTCRHAVLRRHDDHAQNAVPANSGGVTSTRSSAAEPTDFVTARWSFSNRAAISSSRWSLILDAARRWLAKTGLDEPSRTIRMRLDEFESKQLFDAFAFSAGMMSLAMLILSHINISDRIAGPILVAITVGAAVLRARSNALAVLTVDMSGVRIDQFARRPRFVMWHELSPSRRSCSRTSTSSRSSMAERSGSVPTTPTSTTRITSSDASRRASPRTRWRVQRV